MRIGFRKLVILSVVILVCASSTVAITNHNLQWGFEVGDQFHYRYYGELVLGTLDFYIEINSLPTIPDNVTSYNEIILSPMDFSYYYDDGTEMHLAIPWGAAPIGNWTLVQELVNNSISYELQWINTTDEWGGNFIQENETLVRTTTIKYSKTDGALNLFRVDENPVVGVKTRVEVTRINDQIELHLPIEIGLGIVAMVVIVIVVRRRR
jgi:hypothetical protein